MKERGEKGSRRRANIQLQEELLAGLKGSKKLHPLLQVKGDSTNIKLRLAPGGSHEEKE